MDNDKQNEETDSPSRPSLNPDIDDNSGSRDSANTVESQISISNGHKDEALAKKENLENIEKSGVENSEEKSSSQKGEKEEKQIKNEDNSEEPPVKFKLRLVPLEKLLEKPVSVSASPKEKSGERRSDEKKNLPQRKSRANVSIIELSSSDESSSEDELIILNKQSKDSLKNNENNQGKGKENESPSLVNPFYSLNKTKKNNETVVAAERSEKVVSPKASSEKTSSSSNNKSKRSLESSSDSESSASQSKKAPSPKRKVSSKTTSSSSSNNNKSKRILDSSSDNESSTSQSKSSKAPSPKRKVSSKTTSSSSSSNNNKSKRILVSSGDSESSASQSKSSRAPCPKTTEPSSSVELRQRFKLKRCVVRLKRCKLPSSDTSKSKQSTNKRQALANRRKQRIMADSDASDFEAPVVEENEESVDESPISDLESKSSGSEVLPARKKRVFQKKDSSSDGSSSDYFEKSAKNAKKKRRVKKQSSDDESGSDNDEKQKNKRKDIRKIIKTKDLDKSTKEASKEEEERRKRILERQKIYNQIYVKPESTEVNELVLDFDPDTKKVLLQVDKGLLKKLKPHQVAGVKFMWDACFETLKDAVEKPGSGCILAHCMGLGKTLQVVALSHTLLVNSSKTGIERVLIISPLSTLNNWAREFKHWMSFAHKKNIEIYDMSRYKDKPTRIFKLNEWFEEGGVCIIGYDMYRILANEKAKGLRKKQREQLQSALVDPGPDMVVCDEGHLLKNEKTSISKAVTKMRTRRRIVLTGTPLQNNLKEYYCMIQFIKPNLLGTYKEYMNRFVNPITNGQYTDSTERDIRLMKHRSHILHQMLEGCMQRRDYSVLAPYLPPKYEYVVYTTLSEIQQTLYEYYMTTHRDLIHSDIGGKGARLFQDFQDLRRIWTHPKSLQVNSDIVIAKRLLNQDDSDLEDFICDDDDESEGTKSDSDNSSKSFGSNNGGGNIAARKIRTRNGRNDQDSDLEELTNHRVDEKDDPSEWWKRFVNEEELNNIYHSPKLVILMQLIQQCEAIGDKLLLFSQSLQSLDVIEHFLSIIDNKTRGYEYEGNIGNYKGFWTPGEDYFRLDGSCSVEQREAMCKKFNDPLNLRSRLFLISTRAGGLGINLVAANRVVIFDVSWNPSHDTQSIFRVYRFGQEKPCYIYRLIAMGTMEQKVYERQVTKQATAKRVIDEHQISRHYNSSDLQELYTYELKPSVEREIPILPKDRLFAELLAQHESLLFKYHEHDSLLENEESENLTEAERKAAWSEYEAEKTRTVQTAQYISYDRSAFGGIMPNQFGSSSGSVTSNKIFGFRTDVLLQLLNMKVQKDFPDLTQNQVIQLVPTYLQRLYAEMNSNDPSMYKDLLQLHSTIAHPSGLYMNPLLYANQQPSAAGYFQNPAMQQPGYHPMQGPPPVQPSSSSAGFEPNTVYEID